MTLEETVTVLQTQLINIMNDHRTRIDIEKYIKRCLPFLKLIMRRFPRSSSDHLCVIGVKDKESTWAARVKAAENNRVYGKAPVAADTSTEDEDEEVEVEDEEDESESEAEAEAEFEPETTQQTEEPIQPSVQAQLNELRDMFRVAMENKSKPAAKAEAKPEAKAEAKPNGKAGKSKQDEDVEMSEHSNFSEAAGVNGRVNKTNIVRPVDHTSSSTDAQNNSAGARNNDGVRITRATESPDAPVEVSAEAREAAQTRQLMSKLARQIRGKLDYLNLLDQTKLDDSFLSKIWAVAKEVLLAPHPLPVPEGRHCRPKGPVLYLPVEVFAALMDELKLNGSFTDNVFATMAWYARNSTVDIHEALNAFKLRRGHYWTGIARDHLDFAKQTMLHYFVDSRVGLRIGLRLACALVQDIRDVVSRDDFEAVPATVGRSFQSSMQKIQESTLNYEELKESLSFRRTVRETVDLVLCWWLPPNRPWNAAITTRAKIVFNNLVYIWVHQPGTPAAQK